MNREELHILIERYFDGYTTITEEELLLAELLTIPPGDAQADETLAVMGYSRISRHKATTKGSSLIKIAAAVAIILVISCLTGYYFLSPVQGIDECYAYVGGERIESENVVNALVAEQLEEMSDVSGEVDRLMEDDLEDFRDMFNSETP